MRDLLNTLALLAESDILVQKPNIGAVEEFYQEADELLEALVKEYKRSDQPTVLWRVVPAVRLKRIWADHQKTGIVRDSRGLRAIADQFYRNTLQLYVNTEIAEHGERSKEDILDEWFDDSDEMTAFVDWAITTEKGGWRISDYGLPRLIELAQLIRECFDDDDLLMLCDAVLNVTHPRSDLASWYVEGGSQTMDELFEA